MLPQHSDIEIAWYASIQQEPNGWKTVTTQFYIQEFSEYIAPLQDAVDLGMKLFVTHVTVTAITISKVQNVY
ncbi:tail fiber assembly protein [Escherichia coli]|nr:tail fiber assembly protein [Escherichia coli]